MSSVKDLKFETYPVTFKECAGKIKNGLSPRYVSAEIEVAKAKSATALMPILKEWQCSTVTDGSLDARTGFEINTAPQKGANFPELIQKICLALKDGEAKVAKNCGLHVHVDMRDFDVHKLMKLVRLYAHVEPALFSLQPHYRRCNSSNCSTIYSRAVKLLDEYEKVKESKIGVEQSIAALVYNRELNLRYAKDVPADMATVAMELLDEDLAHLKASKYGGHRYQSLNIASYFHMGTVECRLHCGTVNPKEIINWGHLIGAIVEAAKEASWEELNKLPIHPFPANAYYGDERYKETMPACPMNASIGWPSWKPAWDTLLAIAPRGSKYYFSSRRKRFANKDASKAAPEPDAETE